ncbi:hypothetical protein K505DRAFT_340729 [Melanomma pulvis-pyrius CBS 109.77]|uniref:Uncharacterized protein n=1 Tax=Melanomma pulvis-pyrius CBS 109.77 TaxID=1314802 RepID=A0A6A6X187_9PLEO|nr:hypothetical protein K505DRAFT_340729 [Melanomma pulvis-pyrius CBS 109.77]
MPPLTACARRSACVERAVRRPASCTDANPLYTGPLEGHEYPRSCTMGAYNRTAHRYSDPLDSTVSPELDAAVKAAAERTRSYEHGIRRALRETRLGSKWKMAKWQMTPLSGTRRPPLLLRALIARPSIEAPLGSRGREGLAANSSAAAIAWQAVAELSARRVALARRQDGGDSPAVTLSCAQSVRRSAVWDDAGVVRPGDDGRRATGDVSGRRLWPSKSLKLCGNSDG